MKRKLSANMALLAYGAAWGLSELFLGSYLHAIHFAGKGYVLGGIGCTLLARYAARYRSLRRLPLVGVIAAGMKLGSAALYGLPLGSRAIVNPTVSILIETLAVTVAAAGAAVLAARREAKEAQTE